MISPMKRYKRVASHEVLGIHQRLRVTVYRDGTAALMVRKMHSISGPMEQCWRGNPWKEVAAGTPEYCHERAEILLSIVELAATASGIRPPCGCNHPEFPDG